MKKLFSLKKWLTLDEAARHLTIVLGEDVCLADVLRLVLDRHLKLSVYFVNRPVAKRGHVVPIEEAEYIEIPQDWRGMFPSLSDFDEKTVHLMKGLNIDDKSVLQLKDEIIHLDGLYDLPMLGSESLDIEHLYQNITNGPDVELTCLDGTFLSRIL